MSSFNSRFNAKKLARQMKQEITDSFVTTIACPQCNKDLEVSPGQNICSTCQSVINFETQWKL